jgi:hypothetical protein
MDGATRRADPRTSTTTGPLSSLNLLTDEVTP